MEEYQTKLFNELVELTENNEAFYITKQELDGKYYWIFLYRIASYTDFIQPSALESRGIMFEVNEHGNPIRLASMPMHKFFNLNENPMTMDLDHQMFDEVMLKEDGSLISSYFHNGELRLKSKGSLFSQQALDAMEWLNKPENSHLKGFISYLTDPNEKNITVNMEWTSPLNRIVCEYDKPSLTILNLRYNYDGQYVKYTSDELKKYFVKDESNYYSNKSIEELRSVEGIEGWVVKHKSGTWFKLKTDWYVHLHHNKDSINNPKSLFNAVLNETTDDLKQLFETDVTAITCINKMEEIVEHHYNHTSSIIEEFYERNKNLDKRDFAILGQKELDKSEFSVVMSMYTNSRKLTVKDIMLKNYKKYVSIYEEEIKKLF